MEATVTKAFPGVPDGEHHAVKYSVGDIVTGNLAEVAVANGWAVVGSGQRATEFAVSADDEAPEAGEFGLETADSAKPKRGRTRKGGNDD